VFGYVLTNCKTLSDAQKTRFRSFYCGMCRTLKERYGNIERLTLSNDMTFLALVLSALYEPEEISGSGRCLPHPIKSRDYVRTPYMEYAVDMNVALAYHKCRDNWQDDKNPVFAAASVALKRAYRQACAYQPEKCRAIEDWMRENAEYEKSGKAEIDPPMNMTGRMMGTLFACRDDVWAENLYRMGDALGRFIYFMDAYEDLPKDVKNNKFNPLRSMMNQADYEDICRNALMMMIADCAEEFERLPIIRDADLIRNIIYSGVWAKYGYIQGKKEKANRKGAE